MLRSASLMLVTTALFLSLGCDRFGIESSQVVNKTEPVARGNPNPQKTTTPPEDLPGDEAADDLELPKEPAGQTELPESKPVKPAAMNPPFPQKGDKVWVLDFYVFGGIEGRTDRLRISSEGEVILRQWNKVAKRRPLTDQEAKEFADLKKNYRAERRQQDDGPHPDGMSSGVFFAGQGKANGLAKITRFAETIIRPDIYKPAGDAEPLPKKVRQ